MNMSSFLQQLDELAQSQPGALEAALEEMVNSGFGDLQSQLPADEMPQSPAPGGKAQACWGWW